MNEQDIEHVSELLCACYRWMGERDNLNSDELRFLVEKRGSVDTIRDEMINQQYLVACDGDDVIGMVAVKKNDIAKMYVHPDHHRRGVGKRLFAAAERIIAGAGYDTLTTSAFGEAPVPFYESMGMTVTRRFQGRPAVMSGRWAYVLKKDLKAPHPGGG